MISLGRPTGAQADAGCQCLSARAEASESSLAWLCVQVPELLVGSCAAPLACIRPLVRYDEVTRMETWSSRLGWNVVGILDACGGENVIHGSCAGASTRSCKRLSTTHAPPWTIHASTSSRSCTLKESSRKSIVYAHSRKEACSLARMTGFWEKREDGRPQGRGREG